MRNKTLFIGVLALFAMVAFVVAPTRAHPPSDMTLSYDYDDQQLTVAVSHSVADMNTH